MLTPLMVNLEVCRVVSDLKCLIWRIVKLGSLLLLQMFVKKKWPLANVIKPSSSLNFLAAV